MTNFNDDQVTILIQIQSSPILFAKDEVVPVEGGPRQVFVADYDDYQHDPLADTADLIVVNEVSQNILMLRGYGEKFLNSYFKVAEPIYLGAFDGPSAGLGGFTAPPASWTWKANALDFAVANRNRDNVCIVPFDRQAP